MKLFFLASTILCLTICSPSFAQEDNRNYLGGSFGGSDFHIKDDHASPLIFSSIGFAPSLQYIHKGDESRHYAEASYFYDYLGTSSDNFHTDNHRGRLRYCYLHSVTNIQVFGNKFGFFLGGSASSFLCHSEYYYLFIPPDFYGKTIESWYWSSSLDISAQLEYNPAPGEFLSVQLFLPIVSNVSRPKYSPSGNYNYIDNDWKFKMFGETKFFPKNFSVNALLTYHRPLIWNFNLQICYEFYYSSYDEPREVNMYMNNVSIGLFFCF